MPCTPAKAKHLLKAGKAKWIRRTPFTMKLLWDCEENTQEVVAGMDTGSKTMGCAAVAKGKVVYQSEVQVRQDVSKKMEQRRWSKEKCIAEIDVVEKHDTEKPPGKTGHLCEKKAGLLQVSSQKLIHI